ncbi:hypothetical protein [Methylobacterium sp. 174MFSha1.1]|nr:hypothetical protein [Methylobacterium sp. 174MFSha1.1]
MRLFDADPAKGQKRPADVIGSARPGSLPIVPIGLLGVRSQS